MKTIKIIGRIFATVFAISLFALIVGGTTLVIAIKFISKDNISLFVQEMDVGEIVIETDKNGKNTKLQVIGEDNNGKNKTLKDKIKEKYTYEQVDPRITENLLDIPEVKEVIGNLTGEYVEYILNRRVQPKIDDEEIDYVINSDNLQKVLNKEITKKDKTDIKNILTEVQYEFNEIIENEELKENYLNLPAKQINLISYFLSPSIIFIIISSIICIIILLMLCIFNLHKSLLWVGIPTFISGLVLLFLGAFSGALIKVSSYYNLNYNLDVFVQKILKYFIISGGIVIVLGITLIIIYYIIKGKDTKKEEKPKPNIGNKFCLKCGAVVTTEYCVNCGEKSNQDI